MKHRFLIRVLLLVGTLSAMSLSAFGDPSLSWQEHAEERLSLAMEEARLLAASIREGLPTGVEDAELLFELLEDSLPERGVLSGGHCGLLIRSEGRVLAWSGRPRTSGYRSSSLPDRSRILVQGDSTSSYLRILFPLSLEEPLVCEIQFALYSGYGGIWATTGQDWSLRLFAQERGELALPESGPWNLQWSESASEKNQGRTVFLGETPFFHLRFDPQSPGESRESRRLPGASLAGALAVLVLLLHRWWKRRRGGQSTLWHRLIWLLPSLLVLRLLLHASGIPGDHSLWFSIPAWGGLLSSPGDLFLTALFLLFGLAVLLRPVLLSDSEESLRRPLSSSFFIPAILLPFLASFLAHFLSRRLFQAASPQWLFQDPLPGGPAFLLDLSLFLFLLALLGLFLLLSRMAWSRVPDLRRLRIPALLVALILPLAGPSWTLFPATLLLLLASQGGRDGQVRRSGKLFPLLLLSLAAGLLAFGGREFVQLQYLPFLETGGEFPWGDFPPLSRISPLPDGSPSFSARLMALLAQFSFSLTALVLLLLLDLGLTRLPYLRNSLPPLFMPRGPGFRHRLLAGFLLVALLPTALIAFLGAEQVLRQMDRASQRSSLERAHSALRILEEEVRQEATLLAAGEYVRDFLLPATLSDEAHAKIPEMHELMIFDGEGRLKLDETFRGWTSAQADSFLRSTPRSRMSFELLRDRQGRPRLYAAYLLPWSVLDHEGRKVPCTVYYRKQIQSDLLARIVREIEGELALYLDGQRVQASPGALRLCSDFLSAEKYREIFLSGKTELLGTGLTGEEPYGQCWISLHDSAGRVLAVLSSLDYPGVSERSAVFQQGLTRVFALSSLLVLLALGLGSFLAERVYGPIRSLQIGTRRIAEGDFREKIPASGNDEIGELVDSFNLMSDQLEEAQEELVRKKQLEAWSEMARQVAHEIKNPLTPIQLSVQHAERAWKDKSERFPSVFEDTVRTVRSQVEILGRIAREFSSFGRIPALKIQKVDLAAMAGEILLPYRGELDVQLQSSDPLWVMADAEALRKVLLNLIENAREAMESGGRLEVSWQQEESMAVWLLRDFGTGISDEARERLFEPYFSTKTSGTGLGLAICAQLLEEMKGDLALINQEGGGVLTRLQLPPAED